MNKGNLLEIAKFVIKTGICTMPFIIGVMLLLLNRQRWEAILAKLAGVREVEASPSATTLFKVCGVICILISVILTYFVFIHTDVPPAPPR